MAKASQKIILLLLVPLLLFYIFSPLFAGSAQAYTASCPDGSDPPKDCQPCSNKDNRNEKGGLVPCGRYCDNPETDVVECCPCTLCHVFLLINRLVLFARNAAFLAAAILIVVGGVMMLLSGAYQDLRSKGKSIVTNAITGLFIVLLAWLIVASIIVVLAGRGKAQTYFNLRTASFIIQCTAE